MTSESTPSTSRDAKPSPAETLGAVARATRRVLADTARAVRDPRLLRELAPLAIPLVLFPWLLICAQNYAHGNVFRDTTLLNYAAWCMLHGDRIYSTVSVMDGPLALVSHAIFIVLGGSDESRWRQIDLAFQILAGGSIGLVLAPRASRFDLVRKAVWFAVGVASWLVALYAFDFPASVQREAHYAGLGLFAMALVYRSADRPRRSAAVMLCVAGLLAGWVPWGKQTAGIYLLLALLTAVLLPKDPQQPRLWRAKWLAIGIGASLVTILGFVAAVGSLRGLWHWFFEYNLVYYRFHDDIRYRDIFTVPWAVDAEEAVVPVVIAGLVAVALRALPARALAFVIAPAVEVLTVVLQHKGWRYQFIPPYFCANVAVLLALAHAFGTETQDAVRRLAHAVAAIGLSLYVGYGGIRVVEQSPWTKDSEGHSSDPATTDPIAAAKVLAEHTRSEDRVLHFGDEPVVLLLAKRHPATEYLVPWELDLMRHVTVGDFGATPTEEARVRALEAHNRADECSHVIASPPPALVFKDNSVGYPGTISDDFFGFCPAFRDVVSKRYHELRSGPFHIWLRDDRP